MSGGTASMRYPYDADADASREIFWFLNTTGMELKSFYTIQLQLTVDLETMEFLAKEILNMKEIVTVEHLIHTVEKHITAFTYTTAFYERAVVGIRASDGRCMVKYNLGGYPYI